MKKWNKFLMGLLAMCAVAGCSDDRMTGDSAENGVDNPKDAAYLSVSVSLPSKGAGTRSSTNDNGGSNADPNEEVGLDHENTVKSVLLVLTDDKHSVAVTGYTKNLSTSDNKIVTPTAKINRTQLYNAFYDPETNNLKEDFQNGIKVYVFCNPPQDFVKDFELGSQSGDGVFATSGWQDKVHQVVEDKNSATGDDIWKKDNFLMSNAEPATRNIPNSFKDWQDRYSDPTTPFDLSGDNSGTVNNKGTVKVERSVARFDFKDGSAGDNTYNLGEGTDAGKIQVRLYRMALVNMSKEFYYLRRVSDDGTPNGSEFEICGLEHSTNYVVDNDWEFKSKSSSNSDLNTHFNYPLFNTNGEIDVQTRNQWDRYWIDDVTAQDKPEDHEDYDKPDYRIWRYVTENTIPGENKQLNGITTGIVFKGKLQAGQGLSDVASDLANAINGNYQLPTGTNDILDREGNTDYPILYLFNDKLYVGWNAGVVKAAGDGSEPEQYALHAAVTNTPTPEDGSTLDKSPNECYQELLAAPNDRTKLDDFRKAATAAGFTLYQVSNDQTDHGVTDSKHAGVGYFFYYYYWNRHNDNGKPGTMGPMEFAVVRNNVYKLLVKSISKLGHPRITDNDPNPPTPEKPDEEGNVYITVSVEVLPWVVRENNIEF